MAAAKRKKPPPKRATRSLLAARPTLRLPNVQLEPHHIDILGLGLIAVGILLGGVAYGGWDGGALGNGAVTGMRFVLGALGYVVPGALAVGGGLVLARETETAGPAAADRDDLPDVLDHARPRGGNARSRPGCSARF